jgi:hypothetical protein
MKSIKFVSPLTEEETLDLEDIVKNSAAGQGRIF